MPGWDNLQRGERQELHELLAVNRRLAKAHLLKEQLAHLWDYTYEGAAWRFLTAWVRALRWQRPGFHNWEYVTRRN